MEWSKELTTHLIELFHEQRVLWDPKFKDFKNRNKKQDAWNELATALRTDASEVEKKMRMLIGQFQRELKKGKSDDEAQYRTKWMFFKMLLFLKDKNEPNRSTEGEISNIGIKIEPEVALGEEKRSDLQNPKVQSDVETTQKLTVHKTLVRTPTARGMKRRAAEMKSKEGYAAVFKQFSNKFKERDEFDVYGEYVANTLRKIKNKSVLSFTKYEINTALYRAEEADLRQNTAGPSFTPFATLRLAASCATPTSPATPLQSTDTQSCTGTVLDTDNSDDNLDFT